MKNLNTLTQIVKTKRNKILWIFFFGLLTVYNFCTFIYPNYPNYKSKKELLKVPFGIMSNQLRIKLKIPIIDKYMEPVYEYGKFKGSNRWESSKEFPDYGEISHPFKNVDADWKTLKLKSEWDAYRRKFNDSIFQQINIYSKIEGDSASKREGSLFYLHKNDFLLKSPYNIELKLGEQGIDSVAKKWHLNYLVKGK